MMVVATAPVPAIPSHVLPSAKAGALVSVSAASVDPTAANADVQVRAPPPVAPTPILPTPVPEAIPADPASAAPLPRGEMSRKEHRWAVRQLVVEKRNKDKGKDKGIVKGKGKGGKGSKKKKGSFKGKGKGKGKGKIPRLLL